MIDLTSLRAFADTHRELADKADALILALEAAEESTPAEVKIPRFIVAQINGVWGVLDSTTPDEWADFDETSREDVIEVAKELNANPSERDDWSWTPRGEL